MKETKTVQVYPTTI